MIDKHENALMSQLANLNKAARDKEKELEAYRVSKCHIKTGDIVQARGASYKVYAVESFTGRTYKLRCYRQKKDGTFGQHFCVVFSHDVTHVMPQ